MTVAKSSVAMSSVLSTGLPHAEQKRTWSAKSLPHDGHFNLISPLRFSRLQSIAGFGFQPAALAKINGSALVLLKRDPKAES